MLAQHVRGHLRLALAEEDPLQAHTAHPIHRLHCLEVDEVPHIQADYERSRRGDIEIAGQKLRLILLGEHLERMAVQPGDCIRAEFGADSHSKGR